MSSAPTAVGEHRTQRRASARASAMSRRAVLHAMALVLAVVLIVPFAWAISGSLKPAEEVRRIPPTFIPEVLMWSNYVEVVTVKRFPIWAQNTAIISILSTLGTVITAALAGYSFARFRFPGRSLLFGITLSTMMLPQAVTLIPTYFLFFELGWLNTFYPLIVPFWFGGGAFYIFLFRQFFMSIPTDLDEAAKIDGASYLMIFFRIILPLSLPVFATVGIIAFIAHYNDFLYPLLILNDPEKFTLSIGLRYFNIDLATGALPQDNLLLAMAVLMTLPIVLLFFVGQRYFVQGVVMSGIKG